MQISITFSSMAALFGFMIIGASLPTVSTLAVAARSSAFGFTHGVFTSMGIVLGDIIFILIAILGLAVLAETMGSFFILVKYLGGTYLIVLGIMLWRSKTTAANTGEVVESSLLSSFMAGLLITLADQKAILFYLGIFPAFFNLSEISYLDISVILLIAIVGVGSPKLCYAYLADKASSLINAKVHRGMNIAAGSVIIGAGVYLLVNV